MSLRIHAIILALNEEPFIENQLRTLYPFCSGISVITQYDRDWYGRPVRPDRTVELVLGFPDPVGKIHLIVRRFPDEAAARNAEMGAALTQPDRRVMSHGSPLDKIRDFHAEPDYFWIVDADEFYDVGTVPAIIARLGARRPRGMRVHGLNYLATWNRRVPAVQMPFCHFGFIRSGVLFECRRTVSWDESRLAKLLRILRLPDFSARVFGFETCPWEVGFFHHGCWLGGPNRLSEKVAKSSHQNTNTTGYQDQVLAYQTEVVRTEDLPLNIREAKWPSDFWVP
jgi:hypothetical protein